MSVMIIPIVTTAAEVLPYLGNKCSAICFYQSISFLKGFQFAYMYIQAPKTMGWFSLRLDVYLPSLFLQCDRRFYHYRLCLAFVRRFVISEGTSLCRLSTASSLLLPSPIPSRHSSLFPCAGYRVYLAPELSSGVRRASPVA